MTLIISVAVIALLAASVLITLRYGFKRLSGEIPVSLFSFMAILFTSGLDAGLIMFPLANFPIYRDGAEYQFTNPLALEFGFWGFLIWLFYFVTSFYFCVVEPKLKLFEIPWIKFVNNIVIIATCAYTGYLFLIYLPTYVKGIPDAARYGLVAVSVILAVLSSTEMKYVKILSIGSTWVFFALIALMWALSGMGVDGFVQSLRQIGGYFANMHRFVTPITDHHEFDLYWWFAWSIMIGQFVARFLNGISTWQLMVALLVLPSIPIAVWFAVLYYFYTANVEISMWLNLVMVFVGVIFVINSLDSLTRLYSLNLNLTVERLGRPAYIALHCILLFGLVLLYQFTPLKIEWIGLVVIGLYLIVGGLLYRKRKEL